MTGTVRCNRLFLSVLAIFSFFLFNVAFISKDGVKEKMTWIPISSNVHFLEWDIPVKSILSDSKLTVIRFKSDGVKASLCMASEKKMVSKRLPEWLNDNGFHLVFNAGMYNLNNPIVSRGQMQSVSHVNNSVFNAEYRGIVAMDPFNTNDPSLLLADLNCTDLKAIKSRYGTFFQSLRMIDCKGQSISWNKRKQSCSMLLIAKDKIGNVYLFFARSPYTHNEMSSFLKLFSADLSTAIYLEGGPETGIMLKYNSIHIERIGSYVSDVYATDTNTRFWKLPNVIGLNFLD